MRGAPVAQQGVPLRVGIIPADAGSTVLPSAAGQQDRDHLRGCGEHPMVEVYTSEPGGSSPRMRGALNRKDYCGRHWQDHLRGCGEHHRFCSGSACRMGSSPRMRGARQSAAVLVPTTRIIPADAGSTFC